MTTIDVGICTFRRNSVADTMRTVAAQKLPGGVTARMIVADNDTTPSAKALVEEVAAEIDMPVTYLHAPERNISIARNAILDAAQADYLAFIDDDEIAPPTWLATLFAAIHGTDKTAVFGPVHAIYPPEAPAWMVEGRFHDTVPKLRGGELTEGHSGNCLFDHRFARLQDLRFDEELGIVGGEDTAFFAAYRGRGGRLKYVSDAMLTECVHPARATLNWLRHRRIRAGLSYGRAYGSGRLPQRLAHLAKALVCLAMALMPTAEYRRVNWQLRAHFHKSAAFLTEGNRS